MSELVIHKATNTVCTVDTVHYNVVFNGVLTDLVIAESDEATYAGTPSAFEWPERDEMHPLHAQATADWKGTK